MTPFTLLLVLLTEICSVIGQLLFKYAVDPQHTRAVAIRVMAAGVFLKAIDFFLWTGLLDRFDLSYLFPFESLNRVLLLIGASVFLKEKASLTLWGGVLLITAGVALVATT